ncbi:sugar-binding transcriptional regulator [Brevibacillus sp. B_LB10_24]|uniref:sugar-binding transcriptional regulator n=1 Tax=Brevibacillus sp. B_LB10_24 TaxID=3380645 RepID=UPI0038B99329
MRKGIENEQMSERGFLERIAKMYYILGLTQKEIAEQLDIGRSSVARFLHEAREEGIVQFHIQSKTDHARKSDLEAKLVMQYKLKDAVVVKRHQGYSFETTIVNYLNSILPLQGSVGLSWGRTMYFVGQFMHLCEPRPQLKLVQLCGSAGTKENEIPASALIQTWAYAIDAKPFFLPAPTIVESKEIRDILLKDENIKNSYQEIRNVDLAIVGIGNTEPDTAILSANFINGLTSEKLKEKSVGDVNLHFFDENGDFTMPEISGRVIGASPLDFMRIPTRVGMAYGVNKKDAILGALKGRIVNILLTDEETAQLLVEE